MELYLAVPLLFTLLALVLASVFEEDLDSESEKLVVREPEDEDAADEAFSFKYSPGKLRGNQYKSMMTKEELEEEQRYVELPCSPRLKNKALSPPPCPTLSRTPPVPPTRCDPAQLCCPVLSSMVLLLYEGRRVQREQLAAIFRLMKEKSDTFGEMSEGDMKEQLRLYDI
ncbi:Matrix-remodeling-associated protein 7 [Anas platyrhynchos]|uniref:Matrix-remodeling-associated protein 7 n=1 Tax=Anas platyrhynchos TaxID=8839 RepID=R0LU18_ANAPL|nr:Matrix-remodeling-associated protein 7 [Anas platyrhynchos]